jgi:hypothetical protein
MEQGIFKYYGPMEQRIFKYYEDMLIDGSSETVIRTLKELY